MSKTQAQTVKLLVLENPGKTASELAEIGDLEQVQVVRRLSELRSTRDLRKGEPRICEVSGSQAGTWWPADEKVKRIPVSEIRIDGGTQPRESIDETLVSEYADAMKAGDKFPAVVVFFDGVSYWLADGFHRTHAARRAELDELLAEIHSGTKRDAVLYSVGANAAHGQRRTNADKRKAVMTLLKDEKWSQWGDQEIARRCAVSPTTVSKYRPECSLSKLDSEKRQTNADKRAGQDRSEKRTYTTKHGTTSTMNTTNIGRKKDLGKYTKTNGEEHKPRAERVAEISGLAAQGYRAHQIAERIGVSIGYVRSMSLEEGITLPDHIIGKTRAVQSGRVIDQVVNGLEGYAISVGTLGDDLSGIDSKEAEEWAAAIAEALKPINKLRKKLMEIAYD